MEMDLLKAKIPALYILAATLLVTSACARFTPSRPRHVATHVIESDIELEPEERARPSISEPAVSAVAQEIPEKEIDAKIREADEEILRDEAKNGAPLSQEIPKEINRRVEMWIKYFTQRDRERFQRFINNGLPYRAMINRMLDDKEMPRELYYLAMIESGFQKRATSPVGAGGIWQFMPGTGRDYGLTVNTYIDDRRSPEAATRAAIEYIKDLHNIFKSWYLAIAAYNAGEYRIIGAIRRAKTRNFWELVEKKALPAETMDYVPKFIAATIVAGSPRQYGFVERPSHEIPAIDYARVQSGVSLADLARHAGVSLKTLSDLNPQLVKKTVPSTRSGAYAIAVPKGLKAEFETRVASALRAEAAHREAQKRKLAAAAAAKAKAKKKFYKVRQGDTLSSIAAKVGVPIQRLKRVNKLRREVIYAGQILKVAQNN